MSLQKLQFFQIPSKLSHDYLGESAEAAVALSFPHGVSATGPLQGCTGLARHAGLSKARRPCKPYPAPHCALGMVPPPLVSFLPETGLLDRARGEHSLREKGAEA